MFWKITTVWKTINLGSISKSSYFMIKLEKKTWQGQREIENSYKRSFLQTWNILNIEWKIKRRETHLQQKTKQRHFRTQIKMFIFQIFFQNRKNTFEDFLFRVFRESSECIKRLFKCFDGGGTNYFQLYFWSETPKEKKKMLWMKILI